MNVLKNGYLEDVITFTIRHKDTQLSSKPKFGPEWCPVYLKLPWVGTTSTQLKEQIKQSVNWCFNLFVCSPKIWYTVLRYAPRCCANFSGKFPNLQIHAQIWC